MARLWKRRRRRGRTRAPALLVRVRGACPRCGYSLRGLVGVGACPECGGRLVVATRRGAGAAAPQPVVGLLALAVGMLVVIGVVLLVAATVAPPSPVLALLMMVSSMASLWWADRLRAERPRAAGVVLAISLSLVAGACIVAVGV